MTLNAATRCLAHGCDRREDCLRHIVIRTRNKPMDDNVTDNACRTHALAFVPLVAPKATTGSFNESDTWRDALDTPTPINHRSPQ